MPLSRTGEMKIVLALAEIEAGDAIACRRLRFYERSAFVLGLLLLGFAALEAANEPGGIPAALAGFGAGTALTVGLHFCLALIKRPVVQRHLDREKIYRSLQRR